MITKLTIGKLALFNHCDMGHIDVVVKSKTPIGNFYTCELKKVHMRNIRLIDSANLGNNMVQSGRNVDVFVQPHELIKYL